MARGDPCAIRMRVHSPSRVFIVFSLLSIRSDRHLDFRTDIHPGPAAAARRGARNARLYAKLNIQLGKNVQYNRTWDRYVIWVVPYISNLFLTCTYSIRFLRILVSSYSYHHILPYMFLLSS